MTTLAEPAIGNRTARLEVSPGHLPPATPISDAKVLTGRQKPMTEAAMRFAFEPFDLVRIGEPLDADDPSHLETP